MRDIRSKYFYVVKIVSFQAIEGTIRGSKEGVSKFVCYTIGQNPVFQKDAGPLQSGGTSEAPVLTLQVTRECSAAAQLMALVVGVFA